MRVAVCVRFSNDMQDVRSIETQLMMCRREIAPKGWKEVACFTDAAASAASLHRPGMKTLLAAVAAGGIGIVYANAMQDVAQTASTEFELLHPDLSRLYRDKVGQLTAAFQDDALKAQAFEQLRALIGAVVLTADAGAFTINLRGELASMLLLYAGVETQKTSAVVTEEAFRMKMVARTGFDRCRIDSDYSTARSWAFEEVRSVAVAQSRESTRPRLDHSRRASIALGSIPLDHSQTRLVLGAPPEQVLS